MDNEKLKQFMVPIAVVVLTLVGVFYLAPKVLESFQGYTSLQSEISTKNTQIQEKQAKLDLQKAANRSINLLWQA